MSPLPSFKFKVDATEFSTVAVCKMTGCDARFLVGSRGAGVRVMAEHCTTAHPGYTNTALHRIHCLRAYHKAKAS